MTAGYGKATPSSVSAPTTLTGGYIERDADEAWYAEVSGKLSKLGLTAGYYAFDNVTDYTPSGSATIPDAVYQKDDLGIWAVGAKYAFDENVKLGAMYLLGDDEFGDRDHVSVDDDGYVVTASYKGAKASDPGSWGVSANYYDQGATTYLDHTMNGLADSMLGFKGYSVIANYTFAKNIVGQVEWYDLEDKEGNKDDADTLWAQLLFTF